MATPIEAPKLGNTVEECLVAKWRKQKGEPVSAGDIVVEIETDKATFEVTAPVSGTLLETFFAEGALVPVFTNLCVIGDPGEGVEQFRPAGGQGPFGGQGAGAGSQGGERFSNPDALPARAASEPQHAERASSPAPGPRPPHSPAPNVSPALSPRARRFAEEHQFHPAAVHGSGPGGRVFEEDLRDLYYSSPHVSYAAQKRIEDGAELRGGPSGAAGRILSSDLSPAPAALSGMREKIARRMRESVATTAQYTLHSSADARGLLGLREKFKTGQASAWANVGIGDMVAFCCIKALLEFPDLNSELIGGKLYRHPKIHLGFACDTPRGLTAPVIRNAHKLSLSELSSRMKELTTEAVAGSISVDDLSGATFTVSNLGSLGIESFTPLLNPPQVAILGVDAIQLKPVRRDGRIDFIDSIGLSLTVDHQVVDGAPGARFLKALKEKIENVESLCTI